MLSPDQAPFAWWKVVVPGGAGQFAAHDLVRRGWCGHVGAAAFLVDGRREFNADAAHTVDCVHLPWKTVGFLCGRFCWAHRSVDFPQERGKLRFVQTVLAVQATGFGQPARILVQTTALIRTSDLRTRGVKREKQWRVGFP